MPALQKIPRHVFAGTLSSQERAFVDEFLFDLDAEAAAFRAGLRKPGTGAALLAKKYVRAAVEIALQRRASRAELYADEALRRWWLLASADARELTQLRLVNCRYCWGLHHQYQFRDNELIEAERQHNERNDKLPKKQQRDFNPLGGGGFDGERDPCRGPLAIERLAAAGVWAVPEPNSDHNCPACDGSGIKSVWVCDSRHLSPGAALLYNGVKVNSDGSFEINHRDRYVAEKMVAAHLGMTQRGNTDPDGLDPSRLTDDQLDLAIQRFAHLAEQQAGRVTDAVVEGERATAEE